MTGGGNTIFQRWRSVWQGDNWVRPFLAQYRKALLASLALGILTMVFAVGLMFTSGLLIASSAEQPERGLFSIIVPLGLVQVFGLGKPFLGYFERLRSHDWVLRLTSVMRRRLYSSVERDGMFWTATHRMGDALDLLAGDIGHVQNLYLRTVFPLVIAWVLWILAVVCFGAFSLPFALFMVLALFVLAVLMPLVSALRNGANQMREKHLQGDLYSSSYDDIAGIADWTFSGRKADFISRITSADAQLADAGTQTAKGLRVHSLVSNLVFVAVSTAVLIWAALQFGSVDQPAAMTGVPYRPAEFIAAFVLGFFPLLEAFSPLPGAALESSAHLDSVERLNRLDTTEYSEPAAVKPEAGEEGTLEIAGLRFAYPGEDELICGIDLRVQRGQKLMVLGPSGSGKSTLASLIRGDLVPSAGRVLVGGVPAASYGDEICEQVSLVQQSSHLFNKTLYSNLTMGDKSITKDEAAEALRAVGLGGLLERLPKGVDTIVDEEGLNFSGGEGHRIALARVLLRKAPIVVFDEPTVALDPITERQLLDTVLSVLEDRTVIMITHHLAAMEQMDRIVFLEDGVIAMDGAPAELTAREPRFQQLLAFDRGL